MRLLLVDLVCALPSIAQDPVITCMTVSPQANRVLVGGRTVDSFEVSTCHPCGVRQGPRPAHGEDGRTGVILLACIT